MKYKIGTRLINKFVIQTSQNRDCLWANATIVGYSAYEYKLLFDDDKANGINITHDWPEESVNNHFDVYNPVTLPEELFVI